MRSWARPEFLLQFFISATTSRLSEGLWMYLDISKVLGSRSIGFVLGVESRGAIWETSFTIKIIQAEEQPLDGIRTRGRLLRC